MYGRSPRPVVHSKDRAPRRVCVWLSLLFLHPLPIQAALLRACRPSDSPLVCRLESILTFLYAFAAFLGLLLVVAVLAAVRAYRRKSKKLSPDEITPDAQ